MLTQPSPSPHSHPVRQHPCFPHRPARSLSSTRGPMWERRGEPHKAGSLLPTQRPRLRHQSRGAPAVPHLPAASLMCCMAKTCKHRPSHASVRTAVLLTPPSTQPGTNGLCPTWRRAGLAPPPRSGLVLHLQGRETSSYGHCALVCRVPPCSGCEPHDERAHPGSHMCPTPQSMKHLVSDVSTVPGHKASYSVQCVI